MLRVRLDGLDDEVELVGAFDFAGYAVIAVWRDLLSFHEVVQAIDPVRGVTLQPGHAGGYLSQGKHGVAAKSLSYRDRY